MSETRNVIIAILVVNLLAFGGIIYETGYFEEGDIDTSTIVTANIILKYKIWVKTIQKCLMIPLLLKQRHMGS